MAWKDSRLIEPLIKYPLANQSALMATLGRFTSACNHYCFRSPGSQKCLAWKNKILP